MKRTGEKKQIVYALLTVFLWATMAPAVKLMQETQEIRARSLGWKDPLKKETATHSGILAWRIPGTEEPGGLQSVGQPRVGHDSATEDTSCNSLGS